MDVAINLWIFNPYANWGTAVLATAYFLDCANQEGFENVWLIGRG